MSVVDDACIDRVVGVALPVVDRIVLIACVDVVSFVIVNCGSGCCCYCRCCC